MPQLATPIFFFACRAGRVFFDTIYRINRISRGGSCQSAASEKSSTIYRRFTQTAADKKSSNFRSRSTGKSLM